MDMDRRQLEALYRYITENYGEDQFEDDDVKERVPIYVYRVVDKNGEHVDFEDNPFDTLEKAIKFVEKTDKSYKICRVEL